MRHWGWVSWPVGNSFMVVISMPGRWRADIAPPAGCHTRPLWRQPARLRAAGLRVLLLAFLAVPDAAARLAPPCMVCMPLAANWLAMPVAVLRASLARPVAMFFVVSMAVCLAASFMALAAICWN